MRQGTNQFTLSRFLAAYMMGYKGRAIFADAADMICLGDVAELWDKMQGITGAVGVVKHQYKTKHRIKYQGTDMQSPNIDYDRKNWASLMLINCEHPAWQAITPKSIDTWAMLDLLQFKFLADSEIESIPNEWNRLVDEDQPIDNAKVMHWTAGIPAFKDYKDAPGADLWRQEWAKTAHPLSIL
jgi:lipopolysaccharide biosynthesis glycosyltransferase